MGQILLLIFVLLHICVQATENTAINPHTIQLYRNAIHVCFDHESTECILSYLDKAKALAYRWTPAQDRYVCAIAEKYGEFVNYSWVSPQFWMRFKTYRTHVGIKEHVESFNAIEIKKLAHEFRTTTTDCNLEVDRPFRFEKPDTLSIVKQIVSKGKKTNFKISYSSRCVETKQCHEGCRTYSKLSDAVLCASVIKNMNPYVKVLPFSNSVNFNWVQVDDFQMQLYKDMITTSFLDTRKNYSQQIRKGRIGEKDRVWWKTASLTPEEKLHAIRVKIPEFMQKYDPEYFHDLSLCQLNKHTDKPNDLISLESHHMFRSGVFLDLLIKLGCTGEKLYKLQNTTLFPTILHRFFPLIFIDDVELNKIAILYMNDSPCALFHLIAKQVFYLKIGNYRVNLLSNELLRQKTNKQGIKNLVNIYHELVLGGVESTPMTALQKNFILQNIAFFKTKPFILAQ